MPKIISNGQELVLPSGGAADITVDSTLTKADDGTIGVVNPTHSAVLTQEEYDALSEEQKKGIYVVAEDSEEDSDNAAKTIYINGTPIQHGPRGFAGSDGTPVGTIISFMGTTPPKDYLACDGSIYNISDYPQLAAFFESQFGSINYFGGDGETTFAVPDMRNLFLRGYHGSATALSGDVGKKQEATVHSNVLTGDGAFLGGNNTLPGSTISVKNADTSSAASSGMYVMGSTPTDEKFPNTYTARPVNMAVLYCIKAVETESKSSNNATSEIYSTDETVVGQWIDGRPLYRRVIVYTVPSNFPIQTLKDTEVSVGENCLVCMATAGYTGQTDKFYVPISFTSDSDKGDSFYIKENQAHSIWLRISEGHRRGHFIYFVVSYTKTTDEPGSGLGTSSPAVTSNITFGHGLKTSQQSSKTLVEVDAVNDFTGDKTLPMTAVGIETQIGNIEALMETI